MTEQETEWRNINPFGDEERGLNPEDKALLNKATKYMTLISIVIYLIVVMVFIPYG